MPIGKERKQQMLWGTAANLMMKDRRIVLAVYVSVGGTLLFLCLGLITQLSIFRWLTRSMMIVWLVICIVGTTINVRNYFRERKAQEKEHQASK